jgi:hypothetical protein
MELLFEVNSRAELILFWTVRAHVESCEHPDQERTNTCVAAALSLSQNILEQSRTAIRTEAVWKLQFPTRLFWSLFTTVSLFIPKAQLEAFLYIVMTKELSCLIKELSCSEY